MSKFGCESVLSCVLCKALSVKRCPLRSPADNKGKFSREPRSQPGRRRLGARSWTKLLHRRQHRPATALSSGSVGARGLCRLLLLKLEERVRRVGRGAGGQGHPREPRFPGALGWPIAALSANPRIWCLHENQRGPEGLAVPPSPAHLGNAWGSRLNHTWI